MSHSSKYYYSKLEKLVLHHRCGTNGRLNFLPTSHFGEPFARATCLQDHNQKTFQPPVPYIHQFKVIREAATLSW
jgi:hypothetical protein